MVLRREDIMNKALGKKIRSLREGLNRSQESIADALHISRQKLARIENGQNDVSFDFLDGFSKIIGIPISAITAVIEETEPVIAFRTHSAKAVSYEKISEMLDLFYANKDLYNSMKR